MRHRLQLNPHPFREPFSLADAFRAVLDAIALTAFIGAVALYCILQTPLPQ